MNLSPALGRAARAAALCGISSLLLCYGCSTAPSAEPAPLVSIAPVALLEPEAEVSLPAEHGIFPASYRLQLLISAAEQRQLLMASLEIKDASIRLSGSTPAGVQLFEGYLDGKGLSVRQQPGSEMRSPVNQVLLDVMLAMCPTDKFTLPEGYVLQDNGWLHRMLYSPQGEVIYEIEYDDAQGHGRRLPVNIAQRLYNYELALRYLDAPEAGEGEVSAGAEVSSRARHGKRFGRDLMGRPINQDGTVDRSQIRQRSQARQQNAASPSAFNPLLQQLNTPAGLPGIMPGSQSTLQSFPLPTSRGQ